MATKGTYRGGSQEESYLDQGGVIKNVHDRYGQALRTTDAFSVITSKYTHFRANYNLLSLPEQVTYYRGTKAHKTSVACAFDIAGSLNNKYFIIRSAPDNRLYHVWFNVDGTGVNPAPVNSTGIEIPISTNDTAFIIAAAITLTINALFKEFFYATRINGVVEIQTTGYGIITNSIDFNSGFGILNSSGEQELITEININYDGVDPYYNGQVLKGYVFDIFEGKFVLKSASGGGSGDASAANQVTQINQIQDVVDSIGIGVLIPEKFDRVQILTKNLNGDPTSVRYSNLGVQVALLAITYDVDGDLIDVQRT